MSGRLQGKVVLVSGAGSVGPGWGNGKAAATLFAREGAKVLCADINLSAAEDTRNIIRDEGGQAEAVRCDVTRADQVNAMVAACTNAFGALDILHNNVGIVAVGGPEDLNEAEWDRVIDVNLKSMFLTAKAAIPIMEEAGGGAIINISSIAAIRWTGMSYLAYSASKAAVNQVTRMIAREYAARGIRCNAILPGLMRTPMVAASLVNAYADGDAEEMWRKRAEQVPMGVAGDAWDVAYAALYLGSDEAKYITGACLVVDGGLTL